MCYICTVNGMECVLKHAKTEMKLENTLRETSLSQKTGHLIENSIHVKFPEYANLLMFV